MKTNFVCFCCFTVLFFFCTVHVSLSSETVPVDYVSSLYKPCGIAVDKDDRKIIADTGNDRVIVLDAQFNPVGVIEGITKGGRLRTPYDVVTDSANRIIVADTGNHCVKIYDSEGYYKKTIGKAGTKGKQRGHFDTPEGVTVDKDDSIIVFDSGNKRVQIFDKDGKFLMWFHKGSYETKKLRIVKEKEKTKYELVQEQGEIVLDHPVRGCVLGDGTLLIADYYVGKFSLWRYDVKQKKAKPIKYAEPKDNFPDFLAGDVYYDPLYKEVYYLRAGFPLTDHDFLKVAKVDIEELSQYPKEFRQFKNSPVDWMPYWQTNNFLNGRFLEPRGVAVDSRGNVIVADAQQNFIVQVSRSEIEQQLDRFNPLSMRIVETTANSVKIEYDTQENVETYFQYCKCDKFLYSEPKKYTHVISDRIKKRHHSVEIKDLMAATRYCYRYLTTHHAFPKDHFSDDMVFTTEADSGKTEYLDLPVLVLFFTNIVEPIDERKLPKDEKGKPIYPDIPEPGPMSEEEIERVKKELQVARMFYWVNSRMKLNLEFDIVEVRERYDGIPFEHWGYYPNKDHKLLDKIIEKYGRKHSGCGGGLCVIYGIRSYNPAAKKYILPGSGGNTWGSTHDGSGISVWNAGGDNAWLFVHEYGHQLGIMGSYNGHIYHFNHFHWNDLEGDYGSHWDGNAYIAREYKASSYLANFYGSVKVVKDSDNDGFPDDDPTCPLDEKRFGTKPYSNDSDEDGLNDLDEILASEWVVDYTTFGGRTAGPFFKPEPFNADTDEDGINDGEDKYPLYPISTRVAKSDITIDGEMKKDEWKENSSRIIDDEEFKGIFRLNWNSDYLYFGLLQDTVQDETRPSDVYIEIDGNNDGFTVGSDNVELTFSFDEKKNEFAVKTLYNDTSVRKQPKWSKNINPTPDDIKIAWKRVGDQLHIEIGVPATPEAGLNMIRGEELGFNFAFKPQNSKLWLRLFEPQSFVDVTLE